MKKIFVQYDSYYDSVFLMSLGAKVKAIPGLKDATVVMGTAMNVQLLMDMGYDKAELLKTAPKDLIIAIDGTDGTTLAATEEAHKTIQKLLTSKIDNASAVISNPSSIKKAIAILPEANLAIISLPGIYAVREALQCLEAGLHIMLFSDNISLQDEIKLKTIGRQKGLLVMGPDCGTAIINQVPLCFANVVQEGSIGIVAASGTGLQALCCYLNRMGFGISQAIGTGGRDLKSKDVGGLTSCLAIEGLAQDTKTKVIILISKPPAPEVVSIILQQLQKANKPSVVHFLGVKSGFSSSFSGVYEAGNLEEAAWMGSCLANNTAITNLVVPESELNAIAQEEVLKLSSKQKWLRGYFTGGTLADEALFLLHENANPIYSNNQTDATYILADARVSQEHTIVDLGDDIFTRGRPHPMIDPSTRNERILAEAGQYDIAIILLDLVLGYGSCSDPAGQLCNVLEQLRSQCKIRGTYISILATVVGTNADYQGMEGQVQKLKNLGCLVVQSNYRMALLAKAMLHLMDKRL